ncbi:MAG TPA: nicotinate phosphoribosyltransferase [Treponema sp.]|nr:nicotinate phosphoribosyltransferase [Treponema sp.]
MIQSALFTDFYELTMAQGYWKLHMNRATVFDMFFRKQPFAGGFSIFAGLEPLLDTITNFRFSKEDIAWLTSLNRFEPGFLNYLAEFQFTGDIWAMDEGTVVFPDEPLLRVHATAIEASIIEGLILNTLNFQSLIATKTARIWLASGKAPLMEFGLRRAQGENGAMSASRASFIGGASGTSNTLAGKDYGIPVLGTMAHAWVMSFETEEEAFRAYAEMFPDASVFLIDTYNSLESGLPAAITVGKELAAKGKNFGIRLDSGDIQYLSEEVRKKLDAAGLPDATITASNELNEEIIDSLLRHEAPIDSWGIGTHMVTGGNEASFTGVYKLSARTDEEGDLLPTMKLTDNPEKMTNPGIKQVWRLFHEDGTAKADVISPEDEPVLAGKESRFYHPTNEIQSFVFTPARCVPLLSKKMAAGKRIAPPESLQTIQERVQTGLRQFDRTYHRLLNPHLYKVSLTKKLRQLKFDFLQIH